MGKGEFMADRFYELLENYIEAYGKYSEAQLTQFSNEMLGEIGTLDEVTIIEVLSNLNNRLSSNNEMIKIIERDISTTKEFIRPEKLEEYCNNMRKNRGEALLEFNNYIKEQESKKNNAKNVVNILNSLIYHASSQLDDRIKNLSQEEKEILVSKLNDSIQKKETFIETLELEMSSRKLKLEDKEELSRVAEANRISVGDVVGKLNSEYRERYIECKKEQADISFYNNYVEMLSVSHKL